MDKNAREKEMLHEWGIKNKGNYDFQKMDKCKDSYFIKREGNEELYIREYTVETLSEMMKELDVMWCTDEIMDQIKKAVGVAALKNKPDKIPAREEKNKLPEFIYNF